jgi:hypothetical protein
MTRKAALKTAAVCLSVLYISGLDFEQIGEREDRRRYQHELQAIYFLDRESSDIWRYYSIARTGKNANGLATGHDASTVNRAVAFFRYLAGIPTDQEPPAAR